MESNLLNDLIAEKRREIQYGIEYCQKKLISAKEDMIIYSEAIESHTKALNELERITNALFIPTP